MNLQVGDLIFTYRKWNLMSFLISYLSKTPWSHVSMYIGDGKIIESAYFAKGVNIIPNPYMSPKFWQVVYRPQLPKEKIHEIIKIAKSKDNVKYAAMQVVFLGISFLLGKIGRFIFKFDVDRGMTCSEFIATCYKEAEVPLCKTPAASTPFELTKSDKLAKVTF